TATATGARTVAIIGGGVSGALTALHLRRSSKDVRIVVVDPRPELGLGLAYSTPSLRHLLNVPAGKISALPTEPEHFLRWLRANYDAEATPMTFAPRAVFGRYIRSLFTEAAHIEHLQTAVTDMTVADASATLILRDGTNLRADFVVLATGNFDPAALPGIDIAAVESGAYCHNAWSEATYANLPADAPICLIGTGLTGVDVVLRLRELGHRGVITAVSRHGVFPNRHAAYTPADRSAIPAGTQATCVGYLRALRTAIAEGMEWRAAIDSLRATTNDLWLSLSLDEQKRFRRHLQRRWDVLRHRMAPPIADLIEAELAAGTLRIEEGHLAGVNAETHGATVTLRTAEGKSELDAGRVINCTGPSMNYRRVGSPLLNSLFAQGVVTAGPMGSGLNSTRSGALIDAQGQSSGVLFNLGPGRLGTLLESIAIPEIRQQAVETAAIIAECMETTAKVSRVDFAPAAVSKALVAA
ncbi:MAG: FAD/NAD(P)-binding protein, partial [Terriglobus roseus]|nr:FAD/NAD(P)-binding protein [Terriglobus roseus]